MTLKWIEDFLTDLKQRVVVIKGYDSRVATNRVQSVADIRTLITSVFVQVSTPANTDH